MNIQSGRKIKLKLEFEDKKEDHSETTVFTAYDELEPFCEDSSNNLVSQNND